MQLAPVEAGQPGVVECEDEQRRVEPVLGQPAPQRRFDPRALFGVVLERTVVHLQPRGVVAPGFEVAHLDARGPHRGLGERERDAHLVEIPSGREAGGAEQRVVRRLRVEQPAHHPASAMRGDVTRGRVEHGPDDLGGARSSG